MTFRMAFLAGVLVAGPALADETCFAAPTRDCLFELAIATALAEDDPRNAAGDPLAIALKQYPSDPDGAGDTIRQTIAMLQAAETKPGEAFAALDWAVLAQSGDLVETPALSRRLALLFEGKDPSVTLTLPEDGDKITRAALRAYALAGSSADVIRLLGTATAGSRRDLMLIAADALMQRGDFAAAFALDDTRDPALRQALDETAVIMLLRQENLDSAAVAAGMTADEATRTASLVKVALAYAKAGSSTAKEIADRVTPPTGDTRAAYVTLNLAETYGRLGDSDRAYALLDQIEPSVVPPRTVASVRLVIALKAADVPAALGFVNELADPRETARAIAGLGDVLVALNAADLGTFLAGLEPVHQAGAMVAVARVHLARGNLDMAEATIRDLRAVDSDGKMLRLLNAPLARALMASGDVAKAMDIAKESNDARLLAELAVLLR